MGAIELSIISGSCKINTVAGQEMTFIEQKSGELQWQHNWGNVKGHKIEKHYMALLQNPSKIG